MTDQGRHEAARAERAVDNALLALEVTISNLRESIEQIQAETAAEKAVARDIRALNDAFKLAQTAEANARDTLKRNLSAIERGELDLDAARAEICERLDRLRAAGR